MTTHEIDEMCETETLRSTAWWRMCFIAGEILGLPPHWVDLGFRWNGRAWVNVERGLTVSPMSRGWRLSYESPTEGFDYLFATEVECRAAVVAHLQAVAS